MPKYSSPMYDGMLRSFMMSVIAEMCWVVINIEYRS